MDAVEYVPPSLSAERDGGTRQRNLGRPLTFAAANGVPHQGDALGKSVLKNRSTIQAKRIWGAKADSGSRRPAQISARYVTKLCYISRRKHAVILSRKRIADTVGVTCEAPPVAEEANRVRRSRRLYARRMPQRKDADGKRERSAKGRAALAY